MAGVDLTGVGSLQLADLVRWHAQTPMLLSCNTRDDAGRPIARVVALNADPAAMVSELLRLAFVGAVACEALAAGVPVEAEVADAVRTWSRGLLP